VNCRDASVERQKAVNDEVERAIAAASAHEAQEEAFDAAHAAYLRARDELRAAKPKTEADATKIMGRTPDHVVVMGDRTLLQWQYKDQPALFDVIQVTIQDGKVTGMNL
jgi:hypothetical protein